MTSIRKAAVLLCLLAALAGCGGSGPEVRLETRSTRSGNSYSVFHPGDLAIRVVTSRPAPADTRCQLSVAAAYTDLATNQPLDLLVGDGRVLQPKVKVGFLDGALTIVGDTLRITQVPKGQSPSPAQLRQLRERRGTLLLQELLVFQGKNLRPAGGSLFQRRALVELDDGQFALIESATDQLSMQQFAADLIELGARNALYLDMGDWDEGWYKDGGQVVKLGLRRTHTARQSNWLVFVRPPAPTR